MTVRGNNKFCNYILISHFNIAGLAAVGPLGAWAGAGKLTNDMQIGMQGTSPLHTGTQAGATQEILVNT